MIADILIISLKVSIVIFMAGNLLDMGLRLNIGDASYTNTIGDALMSAFWEDPNFDPKQNAFYYVRVIEIPKPRWTAYDAKRFGIKMSEEVPMTIQDRAYTSPIWYTPSK